MKRIFVIVFMALWCSIGMASIAGADTMTLTAIEDATVSQANPAGVSNGGWVSMGNDAQGLSTWSFFKFDLSAVPDTAEISMARFRFYGSGSWTTDPGWVVPYDRYIYYHHVVDDSWSESTITWNNMPVYGGVLGRNAPGSAFTWHTGYFEYDAALIDNWNESVDLSDNYLSFVGVVPVTVNYSTGYTGYSSEQSFNGPELYLEYTVPTGSTGGPTSVPEPASVLLMALGIPLFIYWRRKDGSEP